jgi:hypothetical protein
LSLHFIPSFTLRQKRILFGFCAFLLLLVSFSYVSGQTTRTWLGGTAPWSTNSNWTSSGSPIDCRLSWTGNGSAASNNDIVLNSSQYFRSLTFTGTKAYTINGNKIRLIDPALRGAIFQNSTVAQVINAPVFYDDNSRIAVLETQSSGGLTLNSTLELGSSLSSLRIAGSTTSGFTNINGFVSGSSPIFIGLNNLGVNSPNTRVAFNANNSAFTGSIIIESGILSLGSNNAEGISAVNAIEIKKPGILQLSPLSGNINLSGKKVRVQTADINTASILNEKGNNTVSSDIILTQPTLIGSMNNSSLTLNNILVEVNSVYPIFNTNISNVLNGTSNITINGEIAGNGSRVSQIFKRGAGTLLFNNKVAIAPGGKIQIEGPTNNISNPALNSVVAIGGDNLISADASLHIFSGVFRTNGFSQTFNGGLFMNQALQGWIELGNSSHSLTFGNSRTAVHPNATLMIRNWEGSKGTTGTKGQIFIRKDGSGNEGLTADQLRRIYFQGFDENCAGATLIPSGISGVDELVPSPHHAITRVRGSSSDVSPQFDNSGYNGGLVQITGCRFINVNSVTVGGIPATITASTVNTINFKLPANASGPVVVTANGHPVTWITDFRNLGYVTFFNRSDNLDEWPNNLVWLGNAPEFVPTSTCCNNQPITISKNVLINGSTTIPNLNTAGPPINTLTINRPTVAAVGLRLGASDKIPDNTPLVLNGGTFRNYNGTNDDNSINNLPGFNEKLGTLKLDATSIIALGNATPAGTPAGNPGNSDIQFSASNLIAWNPAARLNIYNWKGINGFSGTAGRIFIGTDATGLTAAQLNQISFIGSCGRAILLSTGELIPSNSPEITTINALPAIVNNGVYIGAEVQVNGCNLDNVDLVKVGLAKVELTKGSLSNVSEFELSGAELMKFICTPAMNLGNIELLSYNDSTLTFDLRETKPYFYNVGYISKDNGPWLTSSTWLGGNLPLLNRNVTLDSSHTVSITTTDPSQINPDSVIIKSKSVLNVSDAIALVINRNLTNGGQLITGPATQINLLADASLINNGRFADTLLPDFELPGIVSFAGNGTIGGTNAITFSKLILNGGTINLPLFNSASIPIIKDTLVMNGGTFRSNIVGAVGPKYRSASTLVYRKGGAITRGVEWHSTPSATLGTTAGYPANIIIENNSQFSLHNGGISDNPRPGPTPANLTMGGDLIIKNGSLINNLNSPTSYSGTVEIRGNLVQGIDATTEAVVNLVNSNNHLDIYGDFTRNYTFNTSYSNRITFKGTGNSELVLSGTTNFSELAIQKDGTTGSLTLFSDIDVNAALVLTNGIINTNSRNLRLQPGATSPGGSATSFVHGRLQKITDATAIGDNDFEFKVGKVLSLSPLTLSYKPVIIADIKPNGTTTFSAEYFPEPPPLVVFDVTYFLDPNLLGVWEKEYWQVDRSLGTGKARVGIKNSYPAPVWFPIDPCAGCNVGVVRYEDNGFGQGSWKFTKDYGNFINVESAPYKEAILNTRNEYVYSDVLESFSPFTIGFGYPGILPLHLLTFTAQLQGKDALLQWKMENISDVKHFEIEQSTNGVRFQRLAMVNPAGSNTFQYMDKNPETGIHYYRLKMYEKNGQFTYSRIEWVQVGVEQTIIAGLIQNPVLGGQAWVKLNSATMQTADAMVIDRVGRVVLNQRVNLQQGKNQVEIPVLPLSKGSYFLKLRTKDGVEKVMPFIR